MSWNQQDTTRRHKRKRRPRPSAITTEKSSSQRLHAAAVDPLPQPVDGQQPARSGVSAGTWVMLGVMLVIGVMAVIGPSAGSSGSTPHNADSSAASVPSDASEWLGHGK